jgi:ferric-dicitrate binding protein FerR (iron transport regulator)
MKITKEIIADLFPLYLENECSPDSRALIEEYLLANPQHAVELRRAASLALPPRRPGALSDLDEADALRHARRAVRRRSWVLGLAIFFSLAPFSFVATAGKTYWLLIESPPAAVAYGVVGVACWWIYGVMRSRSRDL